MSKESTWRHEPDLDDTDWEEICDRNCIHYEKLTAWEIVRECLCATLCFALVVIVCIGVMLVTP